MAEPQGLPAIGVGTDPDGGRRIRLSGVWTIAEARDRETEMARFVEAAGAAQAVVDLSGVTRLDTTGALLVIHLTEKLAATGAAVRLEGVDQKQRILIDEVSTSLAVEQPSEEHANRILLWIASVGEAVVSVGRDLVMLTGFLGALVVVLGGAILRPWRFRFTSIVHHIDRTGLKALPIMTLMSLLIGAIIAQQGAFQLRQFGAEVLVVDLVGILVLREIGVLLTAIMVAGRSGSAYTAEIGSMKMREEIDALRVIGLDPVEVLVLPRVIALIIALPILTFLSDMAALIGGGLVVWTYSGISPDAFIERLREAIGLNTYLVGIIKAPFMALIIGLIATAEGLQVEGSAESVGRHTTASVVKAIFMVIVVDGLFAMFFASIGY